ncbi:TetR/AcrR family transcriptional regulator [Pseudonocardia spinosispora]|uniref:TetR/AcrR family transcriptional regulator n=1 Tax=Pseudonocardia spinosispora TaxID=103441 RepID=UPI0003F8C17E|nr:TetR/AcrR family transcriptional regulator [Pseudonocardia spinosispora]
MPSVPPRERLLAAAMDYLGTRGISDLSLRELAEALGTSHRMLIYHFGSKEGLLTEVVRAVEAAQRDTWNELVADETLEPADRPRRLWQRVSDPALEPYVRLFFEIYGQALQGREPATALLDGDIQSWQRATAQGFAAPGADADTVARLGVAVTRGLLMDLLATGDRAEVNKAYNLFLTWYEQATTPAGTKPSDG